MRSDSEAMIGIVLRDVGTNGAFVPCDEVCGRWGGMAHAHLHFDGLNDPDSPYLTVYGYCSCGFLFDPPYTYDVQTAQTAEQTARAVGTAQTGFLGHLIREHGIDPTTDEEWQRRAALLGPEH